MPVFELTFEVPVLNEQVEDDIVQELDAVVASHCGVTTATCYVEAADCLTAARTAIATLARVGAPASRLVDDLVTRGQIAERAGVTRQAVGQWIRGERYAASAFPKPFVLAGGGLWLWGEVLEALAARGIDLGEDVVYPTRRDAQAIGGLFAAPTTSAPDRWSDFETPGTFAVTRGRVPAALSLAAVDSARSAFALSA